MYSVGDIVRTRWSGNPEGDPRDAVVLSKRSGGKFLYLHYTDFDKRLDEWRPSSDVWQERDSSEKLEAHHRQKPIEGDSAKENLKYRKPREPKELDVKSPPGDILQANSEASALHETHNEEQTKMKNILKIVLGGYEIDTWYWSPFPEEYSQCTTLFVCEYCIKYMKYASTLIDHQCRLHHPPGNEIYRDTKRNLAFFEIDGAKTAKLYCQNLCLLAKLFLDHKTLFYDVSPFRFYILSEIDEKGYHIVGYFSKEKDSHNSLSCILVFPQHQGKGYGKMMVDLSYELCRREKHPGSPEKPLSDLAKRLYTNYWTYHILSYIETKTDSSRRVSVAEISQATHFLPEDIIATLKQLDMVSYYRGEHSVKQNGHLLNETLNRIKGRYINPVFHRDLLQWQPERKDGKTHLK